MLGIVGVRSLLDVGCGRGHSSKYFLDKGADILCVEGSHDAVVQSVLPASKVVEHDFTRGPWWPSNTYDACWSVEFLEHVSRHFAKNYIATFRKCALLFVTRSPWGGYHHVEVRPEWWWTSRVQAAGFIYDHAMSKTIRKQALNDWSNYQRTTGNVTTMGQHIRGMMVFVNPVVSSLERHGHLFNGFGCFKSEFEGGDGGLNCTDSDMDIIPPSHRPLINCIKQKSELDIKEKKGFDDLNWICT